MRTILISILVALILLLGGAWAYLLLNGAPESVADIRQSLFGSSDPIVSTPTPAPITTPEPAEARTVALGVPLLQVSDRAVAGAVIAPASSSTVLRYVEKGTGHVYEVSLETGVETRISNTTIPGAVRATWASSGTRTIIETDTQGARGSTYLGTVSTSTAGTIVDLEGLTDTLDNIAFSNGGILFYTRTVSGETVAFARDLAQGAITQLFSLPFSESTVLWDIWEERNHYVYTKPAAGYNGFLYRINGTTLEKIAEGITLSAARLSAQTLLITGDGGAGSYSTFVDTASDAASFMNISTVKEKCAGNVTMWCAANNASGSGFPVSWYQGIISYDDSIYRLDREGRTTLELDPETVAREPLDVTDLSVGPDGRVIFRNKVDDTLWLLNPR